MGLGKEHRSSRFDKMLKIGHLIGVLGRLLARFRHFSGIRVFSLGIWGISLGHHSMLGAELAASGAVGLKIRIAGGG